jgi:hypothetical protein
VDIVEKGLQAWITLCPGLNLVPVIGTIFFHAAGVAMNLKLVEKWKNGIANKIFLHKLRWTIYMYGCPERQLTFLYIK